MKTITHLDMSAIMASYTARVHAEHAAAEAIRESVRNGAARPQPSERLRVTDLH